MEKIACEDISAIKEPGVRKVVENRVEDIRKLARGTAIVYMFMSALLVPLIILYYFVSQIVWMASYAGFHDTLTKLLEGAWTGTVASGIASIIANFVQNLCLLPILIAFAGGMAVAFFSLKMAFDKTPGVAKSIYLINSIEEAKYLIGPLFVIFEQATKRNAKFRLYKDDWGSFFENAVLARTDVFTIPINVTGEFGYYPIVFEAFAPFHPMSETLPIPNCDVAMMETDDHAIFIFEQVVAVVDRKDKDRMLERIKSISSEALARYKKE